VEVHVLHILTKLHLDSRTAAVAYALRQGWV
jgi:DNA-binding NarL/FixJ family response regulator